MWIGARRHFGCAILRSMPEGPMPPDLSRPVATSPDQYTLSIEEALQRYEHAGHPRTARSVQRYCMKGDLDCLRQETPFGAKYKITPESVARHISQIEELTSATRRDETRQDATGRDMSRQDATSADVSPHVAPHTGDAISHESPSEKTIDEPRQVATSPDMPPPVDDEDDPYIGQLEKRLEEKDDMIGLLKGQLVAKDQQIGEMTERARETNFLIKGLQELVLRLQPGSRPPEGLSDPGQ